MADEVRLNRPWMVAVWPGMGHVALSGGYYLMAKLGMHALAEFEVSGLFDVEQVEVKDGLIRAGRLPRSRLFARHEPDGAHDLVVFIGEAQPPSGKYDFCRQLIAFARTLGVERIFTFAAMATAMAPSSESRVFGAATDEETLGELKGLGLEILEDGSIGGLNGVLLGAAAEAGIRGACLLGEMPHVLIQIPYPKASLAVLDVFTRMADLEIDLTELSDQAEDFDRKLGDMIGRMEGESESSESEEADIPTPESAGEGGPSPDDEERIERLFDQSGRDRKFAYELKRELDRLGVFPLYENRFLDLFKKQG